MEWELEACEVTFAILIAWFVEQCKKLLSGFTPQCVILHPAIIKDYVCGPSKIDTKRDN
jgi:hypothetical protein